MQKLTTLFKQYALWLQTAAISLIFLALVFSPNSTTQDSPEAYLVMLGNLSLPYLISGDQTGLRQSLDLIIQDSPVLEARILNTENRPEIQVVNRGASEEARSLASELTSELVLEQALLGTLSISVQPQETRSNTGLVLLALLALALVAGQVLTRNQVDAAIPQQNLPGTRNKKRLIVAISLTPIIEQLKQQGVPTNKKLDLLVKIVRQLAPSYGLEFLGVNDEMLLLQSNSDDKLSLRQAAVFSWNACQTLGAERGLYLRSSICPVELASDTMVGILTMIAEEEIDNCSDIQAGCSTGTLSLPQDLAVNLPKEWDVLRDDSKNRCMIKELPSAVCNLWRRQLESLSPS